MKVMIKCPKTGKLVYTGISTDKKSFETTKLENNSLGKCPACGGTHTWSKNSAVLKD